MARDVDVLTEVHGIQLRQPRTWNLVGSDARDSRGTGSDRDIVLGNATHLPYDETHGHPGGHYVGQDLRPERWPGEACESVRGGLGRASRTQSRAGSLGRVHLTGTGPTVGAAICVRARPAVRCAPSQQP